MSFGRDAYTETVSASNGHLLLYAPFFVQLDSIRHSDEMDRDQLKVEAMRPRVLSDPITKPSLSERSVTPQPLKTYLISRRGKLLCQETGSPTSKTAVGRSQHRRRAASASACELVERRSQVWAARSSRRRSLRRVSWVTAAEDVAAVRHGCPSDPVPQHRRHRTPPAFS